jgi:hypothetical protein
VSIGRRELVIAAGAVVAAPGLAVASRKPADGHIDYQRYIDAFNARQLDEFTSFYAPDVEFALGARTMRGRDAIIDWYRFAWQRITEHCHPRWRVIDDGHVAVELETTFTAIADWPDFSGGPLRTGDVVKRIGFGHYDVRDGQFTRVATALHRVVQAPSHWTSGAAS